MRPVTDYKEFAEVGLDNACDGFNCVA